MKNTLTTEQAVNMLLADKNANWTPNGARAIVEYLESIEDDTGEVEMDICAIRCEFSECRSATDWVRDVYGAVSDCDAYDETLDEDDQEEAFFGMLEDYTVVIPFDGGIIVEEF